MDIIKNIFGHLSTIIKHKHYVFLYCMKCGFFFTGIFHDMSKFSPTEFLYNIKYYEKGKSPINVAKEREGYSLAWFHHKGHNKHHHVYWMDRFDEGCYTTRMPFKYAVEQLCDYLGANKVYNPKNASYVSELEWWKKEEVKSTMHPDIKRFTSIILENLADGEKDNNIKSTEKKVLNKKYLYDVYNRTIKRSRYGAQVKVYYY